MTPGGLPKPLETLALVDLAIGVIEEFLEFLTVFAYATPRVFEPGESAAGNPALV
jgi:hypothetical protein